VVEQEQAIRFHEMLMETGHPERELVMQGDYLE
jgi:hypothetical protein